MAARNISFFPEMVSSPAFMNGLIAIVLSLVGSALFIASIAVWMKHEGFKDLGVVRQLSPKDPKTKLSLFYTHALYMTVAIGFCIVPAAVMYRFMHFFPRTIRKIFHATLNLGGIIFICIGFTAIQYGKQINGYPEFESPHASVGILALALLFGQLLFGIVFYIPPLFGWDIPPQAIRSRSTVFHRTCGALLLVLLAACVGSGAASLVADFGAWSDPVWLQRLANASVVLLVVGIGLAGASTSQPRDHHDDDTSSQPIYPPGEYLPFEKDRLIS